MPNTREEWALFLAGEGFSIFPLRPREKLPYSGESWKTIMSSDPSRIRSWFRSRPDMNYGVCCGSKRVIIDIDNGLDKRGRLHKGEQRFHEVEDGDAGFPDVSALDTTFKVKTPRGGYHLYFSCDRAYQISVGTETRGIIPDVDVRSQDGYALGPLCYTSENAAENTAEGTYEVVNETRLVHVPAWLEARLDAAGLAHTRASNANTEAVPANLPENVARARDFLRDRSPAIEGQGGNHHSYVTACLMKDLGVSEDKCVELMLGEWNDRCEPPWDFDELERLIYNAYHYGNRAIGSKADALSGIGAPTPTDGGEVEELEEGEHYSAVPQPIGEDTEGNRISSLLMKRGDFVVRENEYDFLIPEWLRSDGVTALLGKRGGGKSTVLVDISHRIACDMEWNGLEITQGWSVLYLCGEDDVGLQRMMQAWEKVNTVKPDEARMLVAPAVPNLMSGSEVKAWADECRKRFGTNPVVVFLDTWQRATSTGSQNDDKDMQTCFHNAEALAKALGGCTIASFHPPKSKENQDTIMGSSTMENNTKAIWLLSEDTGMRTITTTRVKGAKEGNRYSFSLTEILLPEAPTKEGRVPTGVVAVRTGGTSGDNIELETRLNELRVAVGNLIEPIITTKEHNKGLAYKEVAVEVLAEIGRHMTGKIAVGFNRSHDIEEVGRLLHKLFPPSVQVDLDDFATLALEGGKFMLKGNGL